MRQSPESNPDRPEVRLRLFLRSAVAVVSLAVSAAAAFAQNYPLPGAAPDPLVICTACPGNNWLAEANAGKPTFPYDTPISLHAGRYVDASSTSTVGNLGMRTVRAGRIRVAPSGRNRIYVALGEALGAYTLDTFFSGKLKQPMVAVNTIPTGSAYGGRNPFEKLAKPDRFFYAESNFSGWTTFLVDSGTVLTDFDADDRGYVYLGTANFGWGIASDPGNADGTHLTFVSQMVNNPSSTRALLSLKNGSSYYVYHADNSGQTKLFDVTSTATPTAVAGPVYTITGWAKYDGGQRVALLQSDGHVKIYTYAGLIAGTAAIADLTPTAGKFFADLSFDDSGNLWLAESTNAATFNLLRKATPNGEVYSTSTFDVFGANAAFSPRRIHAAGNYIAVAGRGVEGTNDFDLRLLKVTGGVPQLQDTNGFFGKYYHHAPSGYAQPTFANTPWLQIVPQGNKTYLFYSAYGLGDVYELSDAPRITSITPLLGPPSGGTQVTIYGSGFTAASTAAFGGTSATTTFVSSTKLTAITPAHAMGSFDVVVSATGEAPMTAPKQFTYALPAPQNLSATATSTTEVAISWDPVPGAVQYEVARMIPNVTPDWSVIATVPETSQTDSGLFAEKTYVYRVRAGDGTTFSSLSAIDAVTMMNEDTAIVTVGTPVLSADLTRLRSRINGVRSTAGLAPASYTDSTPTVIRAVHITELRTRLTEARTALGLTTPAFTDPSLTAGIAIKAVHFNDLLDVMR